MTRSLFEAGVAATIAIFGVAERPSLCTPDEANERVALEMVLLSGIADVSKVKILLRRFAHWFEVVLEAIRTNPSGFEVVSALLPVVVRIVDHVSSTEMRSTFPSTVVAPLPASG